MNRCSGWWGPALLLHLPRGPASPLFPPSELRIGMKGFDHALNPPTLLEASLVLGAWGEPWLCR